jgi:hypothetical protein
VVHDWLRDCLLDVVERDRACRFDRILNSAAQGSYRPEMSIIKGVSMNVYLLHDRGLGAAMDTGAASGTANITAAYLALSVYSAQHCAARSCMAETDA